VLVCFVSAFLAQGALAQKAPTKSEEARTHFEEGTKAFNLGDFPRAVKEYRDAYNAKPDPVFLYNIAQAHRLNNDLSQALFFYRSFLRNMPSAPNRREVEERIKTLESQLAQQKAVATAPPNNTVAPGTTPPANAQTEPPPAEANENKPGPTAATTTPPPATATTAPSTTSTPAAAVDLNASAPEPKSTPVYKKWWLWTVVGVVVVGAAVGTGVALATSQPSAPGSHFGTTAISF
jgi:tetratricopeptide (TPR) repeat protein